MSYRCDICGKGALRGNIISHAHNVSHHPRYPNLQGVRAVVDGRVTRLKVCTRCLRSDRVQKAVRGARPAAAHP